MKEISKGIFAAEFFAGIGLVRMGLERAGVEVVFANDISQAKAKLYASNFGDTYLPTDIRTVGGGDVPTVNIATASFPCTDLSLAGNRNGLRGPESGLIWEFTRVLTEMGDRKPAVVMIENVPGFATSRGGEDLVDTVARLNRLGYSCDVLLLDARHFVAQSRLRLFIFGVQGDSQLPRHLADETRPAWVSRFSLSNPELGLHARPLPSVPTSDHTLESIVERPAHNDKTWWESGRVEAFISSLSEIQMARLNAMKTRRRLRWATAYRRTRNGIPTWEVRGDAIAGCLRTTSGGSSKQALVEAGYGNVRVRWMTGLEYARLQGASNIQLDDATESQIRFALGDAVCVPVIAWLAEHYLVPALADAKAANAITKA